MDTIRKELFTMEDLGYNDFIKKLITTVEEERIIGIRTPLLRKYAKNLMKNDTEKAQGFLKELPHYYYEENNLHGFLIENIKDFDSALALTKEFLPHIDNWATCDSFSPKIFKKHPERMFKEAKNWIKSTHTYTIRYGIGVFHSNFLDKDFQPEILRFISRIESREYYVNMMIAWFFSSAVIKQKKAAYPYLEEQTLDKWTHNKTIQKCIDSFRITEEEKRHLRKLRIK